MFELLLALQTVWPVATPDEFRAAEAAAQAGDRIVMQPGTYVFAFPEPFRVDVPVTVTVASGGRATIRCEISGSSVCSPAVDGAVRLERLDFLPAPVFPLSSGGSLTVGPGAGSVWITDCTALPVDENSPALTVESANVVVQGGEFRAPAPWIGFGPASVRLRLCSLDCWQSTQQLYCKASPSSVATGAMRDSPALL